MSYIEFPKWIPYLLWSLVAAAGVYFIYIVYNYKRGLKTSPREIWFVSISQIIEYTAYSIMLMTLTLFLSSDLGLSDVAAGNYMGTWNLAYTLLIFGVGSLVDAVAPRSTLLPL